MKRIGAEDFLDKKLVDQYQNTQTMDVETINRQTTNPERIMDAMVIQARLQMGVLAARVKFVTAPDKYPRFKPLQMQCF